MDLGRPDRAERLQQLAAEYALGTLPARARRRLDRLARRDGRIAAVVAEWERRLAVLGAAATPVTPPPRVWNGIVARLGLGAAPAPVAAWWSGWRLWRNLAAVSTVAALALGIALFAARPGPEAPGIVVVLAGADARPALIATAAPDARELTIKVVGAVQVAPDRALELWALPEGAAPRSLGLVPSTGTGRVRLPERALERIPALAISLEPPGGSPTGSPTGPVLYSGRIERI
jgi:anti-sigma-K factor RskA